MHAISFATTASHVRPHNIINLSVRRPALAARYSTAIQLIRYGRHIFHSSYATLERFLFRSVPSFIKSRRVCGSFRSLLPDCRPSPTFTSTSYATDIAATITYYPSEINGRHFRILFSEAPLVTRPRAASTPLRRWYFHSGASPLATATPFPLRACPSRRLMRRFGVGPHRACRQG